jgi:AbiJ N-terminal domain 4
MRFSERLGINKVRSALQGRSLDNATRNRLWSTFVQFVPYSSGGLRRTWMDALYNHIWADFFKEPVDNIPNSEGLIRETLKEIFLRSEWYEVYDMLEFIINSSHTGNKELFTKEISRILTEELAGFRLMQNLFIEITDETEIQAIEDSILATSDDRFAPARAHLITALELLSDRRAPNYRNSIKESISAVEAIVQILTGNPQAELGKALKLLRTEAPVHGALRSALLSLYGYTSDADGIRHALIDESNLDVADAKFMLVACSAFVLYLIQKAGATPAS